MKLTLSKLGADKYILFGLTSVSGIEVLVHNKIFEVGDELSADEVKMLSRRSHEITIIKGY